jgi:hypothetical protein
MMTDTTVHGPIDFVLLEFAGDHDLSTTATALIDLIERGIARTAVIAGTAAAVSGRVGLPATPTKIPSSPRTARSRTSATWATPSSLPSSTHHSSLSTRRLRQQPLPHRRRVTVGASSVTPQRLDVPVGSFFALVEFTTGERTRIHSLLRFCAV